MHTPSPAETDPAEDIAAPNNGSAPRGEPGKGSLLVVFLTVFIDLLGFGLVLPLLPIYAQEFGVDASGQTLGLLMASFSAMQFMFAPWWGKLSDRIGRRPVLMVGLAGSTVFYGLFAYATSARSLPMLFLTRIGAGIAGATIPTAQAYIADSTTLEKRSKGMALVGAAFGLGFTFGPLLGSLAAYLGKGDPGIWPGIVAASLSAAAFSLAAWRLPESLPPEVRGRASLPARRWIDGEAWRRALSLPSVGLLILASFVCVFSFANFESTLSLLLFGDEKRISDSPFSFDFQGICYTFAYIGFTLSLAQGFLGRRLAGRFSEGTLAAAGAAMQIGGFLIMAQAATNGSTGLLFGSVTIVVCGFSLLTPSLNSLISRRADPAQQGSTLGVAQSANSLARIVGPWMGITLLKRETIAPYLTASGLMAAGLLLVVFAARGGSDFRAAKKT